jgi:hypothetical protein
VFSLSPILSLRSRTEQHFQQELRQVVDGLKYPCLPGCNVLDSARKLVFVSKVERSKLDHEGIRRWQSVHHQQRIAAPELGVITKSSRLCSVFVAALSGSDSRAKCGDRNVKRFRRCIVTTTSGEWR